MVNNLKEEEEKDLKKYIV